MTNPLLVDIVDIAELYEQLMLDHSGELGLQAVYYGDQDKIPTTPVVCIESDTESSILKGSGVARVTAVTFTIYILVYHSKVQSGQENRRECDRLAGKVKDVINSDPGLKMGTDTKKVIHSYVTNIQAGYSNKANSLMASSRITIEATSQALLPS